MEVVAPAEPSVTCNLKLEHCWGQIQMMRYRIVLILLVILGVVEVEEVQLSPTKERKI